MSPILKAGTAERVSLSPARLGGLLKLVEHWTNEGTIPAAALCVARNGTVVVERGFGASPPWRKGEAKRAPPKPIPSS